MRLQQARRMRKMRRIAVVAMAFTVAAGTSGAVETNKEIVVTASRNSREASQMPANVTVVTDKEIEKAGYENVVEALQEAGGISFRSSSGNPSQAEISMRGFGENAHGRVLVLLDGQKLNRPDMAGINWLQIPLSNVERIEVVRGSDSTLYGDHAVAGVVNIVTHKGTKDTEISVHGSGGSFGENTERAEISGSSGKLSYSMNTERQSTDGYRDRSAFSAWGAGGSVSYDLNETLSALLQLSCNRADYEMPDYLTKEQMLQNPRQSTNPDDSARNDIYNANLGLTAVFGDNNKAAVNFLYGRKNNSFDWTTTYWNSIADTTIDTFGIMPNCVIESSILDRADRLLGGVDYCVDKMNVRRFADTSRETETSSADITKKTLGAYVQNELSLTKSLVIGTGGRVERATIGGSETAAGGSLFDSDTTHDNSAVNVSMTYNFPERSKVFAKVSTIYRYPFVDEQVSYYGYAGDQILTNLDSETGIDVQLGTEIKLTDRVNVRMTLFQMNMRDEIAFNPTTYVNENLDSTRRRGVEAGVAWNPCSKFELNANYTYTAAEFTGGLNSGKDIPLVARHTAAANATFGLPCDLSFRLGARYVGTEYLGGDYANTCEQLSSYVLADVLLRYTPRAMKGIEAFVAVDNVFDKQYASVGYWSGTEAAYYPSAGRAFRVGVSYGF